ncbi:5-demethoxyubiquinone hydroxylase, mitochondrial [Halotydeus destructor]|nr:5-demethoxyubiquinone hydroxylase, mitochondrial [Halotydeus destructor]
MASMAKSAGYLARRRKEIYEKIIRVDLAGELGADRIYWGQMAVLRNHAVGPVIQNMWNEEKKHLEHFEYLALKYRVPKSKLTPFWSIGGFVLGAASALIGPRGAMACTVAVEKVITEHYESQLRQLMADDPLLHADLAATISQFRDDEQHHHDTGIENEAEQAPLYRLLSKAIENVCRVAISTAEKV